jgi:predicted GIY-YIG superfamily endonuclease
MLTNTVQNPAPIVNPDCRPEVIYRAPITGRICRAFVIKEYIETLKVQGEDYRGDPRIIRRDDVLMWIQPDPPTPTPPAAPAVVPQVEAQPAEKEMGIIYIIELETPLGTQSHSARYYMGWTTNVYARLNSHRKGNGSAMLKAAVERGIKFDIVATCEGTRDDERHYKRQKNHSRLVKRWQKAAQTATEASRSDLGHSCPPRLDIRPYDPAKALDRYSALAADRYCTWQVERNYRGNIPLVDGDTEQLCKIAEAHARYGAAMRHVERLTGTTAPPCPTRPTVKAGDVFTALAIAALVELGTSYYTAAPDMSDSLRDATTEAIAAGQLDFCMDVVGQLPHSAGRGVQTVHGNRRYEWRAQ